MFSTVGIPCSCSGQGEIPPCRVLHPPSFNPSHRLSDWPDCVLELRCRCGRITTPAVRLLRERCGRDPSFAELLSRLGSVSARATTAGMRNFFQTEADA